MRRFTIWWENNVAGFAPWDSGVPSARERDRMAVRGALIIALLVLGTACVISGLLCWACL